MLLLTSLLNTAWLTGAALALPHNGDDSPLQISPDADGKYTLVSEGIRAQFIPYGASITNLFINDTNGVERDIVLGFDNATYYSEDKSHPHLGGVPGRYANRIKNSTFTIDGTTYHVTPNENNGADTLHGGPNGWDWRNWTVSTATSSSITFTLSDPAGSEGFPGRVDSTVTYTLSPHAWSFHMTADALDTKTPIMLTSHTYFNLDGFANPDTPLALNHSVYMPYSGQRIGVDGILIPDGTILPNAPGSVNDFWTAPKQVGADWDAPELEGNCGTGCKGYDNCFLVNRGIEGPYDWCEKPVATLSSAFSGIAVDIYSDQDAFQLYSCGGQDGTLALKKTQGFFDDASRPRAVQQYGCLVVEVQDWIDGINHPEWQRDSKQIFGPDGPSYSLEATYRFRVGDS